MDFAESKASFGASDDKSTLTRERFSLTGADDAKQADPLHFGGKIVREDPARKLSKAVHYSVKEAGHGLFRQAIL